MSKMSKKGFTLIELLIVIALLGALAVGLLAALDPFEQLKKGTDTGMRNTVSELHGAVIRYYAIKSAMPWSGDQSGDLQNFSSDINAIIATGELKSDFFELLPSGAMSEIKINATTESVTVCFQPKSRAFRSDPNTKYDQNGGTLSNCPDPDVNTCYWCVR